MGKSISFVVKEDSTVLRDLIRKSKNSKDVLRLQSLIHIKEGTFDKQSELAKHLGYSVRSMELWLKLYKEGGLEAMLIGKKEKQKRKRIISQDVHIGLSDRLKDGQRGFLSYVQAVQWVKETYGIQYKYNTLRDYMITIFGTKIKRPRKSHIKKDGEAVNAFLKTP